MRYLWKPILVIAVLIALVLAGLYAAYKVTEPQGDRLAAAATAQVRW